MKDYTIMIDYIGHDGVSQREMEALVTAPSALEAIDFFVKNEIAKGFLPSAASVTSVHAYEGKPNNLF